MQVRVLDMGEGQQSQAPNYFHVFMLSDMLGRCVNTGNHLHIPKHRLIALISVAGLAMISASLLGLECVWLNIKV